MKKKNKQFHYEDRLVLEKVLKKNRKTTSKDTKLTMTEIAKVVGCCRKTLYNELKRGMYIHRNSDYTEEYRYSSDLAEEKYQKGLKVRGTSLKIGNDREYAEYLEKKIVEDDYSPSAVLGELKATGKEKKFKTKICVTTLYNYIAKDIFMRLSNKDLPEKGKKKRKYNKVKRQKRASAGSSIKDRPEEVEDRENFGHWEMDTVVGKQGRSKNVLLVLTERKTRKELIYKLPSKEAKNVVKTIDRLEKEYKEDFSKIFKTITVDNGTEFSLFEELEKSKLSEGKRTRVFYCHAYSSWERGSNENQNKLIRRKIPKGSNFDNKTNKEIKKIEEWINNYPRKIFDWKSANDLFSQEIERII